MLPACSLLFLKAPYPLYPVFRVSCSLSGINALTHFFHRYTRSSTPSKKQKTPTILETRHDTSTEYSKVVRASDEGVYEVVSIKDRYCAYTKPDHKGSLVGGGGQKRLTY
jgi:hypothetical protein